MQPYKYIFVYLVIINAQSSQVTPLPRSATARPPTAHSPPPPPLARTATAGVCQCPRRHTTHRLCVYLAPTTCRTRLWLARAAAPFLAPPAASLWCLSTGEYVSEGVCILRGPARFLYGPSAERRSWRPRRPVQKWLHTSPRAWQVAPHWRCFALEPTWAAHDRLRHRLDYAASPDYGSW